MNANAKSPRAVIVTGGARGIGLAIAQRLASDGARVAIWDRDEKEARAAAKKLGADHLACPCDVTSADEIESAAEKTWAAFGIVDGLVNNAGVLGPVAPLWEHSEADFRRVIDINLLGTFLVLKICVSRFRAQPGPERGRIVNVSSIQAKEGMALGAAYGASKAGLVALTKTLGKELAEDGILVNCITPVAAETAMAQQITPARRADIVSRIPMRRFIAVEEIAAMTAWLLSRECSFSTGAVFDLSGGRATY